MVASDIPIAPCFLFAALSFDLGFWPVV